MEMEEFSNEEYADMLLMFGLADGNAVEAVRCYANNFPNRRVPNWRTFIQVDKNLRETGSFKPKQATKKHKN